MLNKVQFIIVGAYIIIFLMPACLDFPFDFRQSPLSKTELENLDFNIKVSLKKDDKMPFLQIDYSFNMPRKWLAFQLPSKFLRTSKLYERIHKLEVISEGYLQTFSANRPHIKILRHEPNTRVKIRYHYLPYNPNNKNYKETFFAPIIREDYFQFVGSMAFILPLLAGSNNNFPITFQWDLPKGFKPYNSFGANEKVQKLVSNSKKLMDSLFIGGKNIRLQKKMVLGNPVHIIFEGHWDKITDDELANSVTKLLKEQRTTFYNFDFPYFLASFLSFDGDCQERISFAGTAHINSFRAHLPKGCPLIPEMIQLISHELMHMYIGKKIKVGKESGHVDGKWFTEGFTDYYGRLFAYRSSLITLDEYFTSLNRQIQRYLTSPAREATLSHIIRRLYRNNVSHKALESIPYQRGELLAMRINKNIKLASNFKRSLDNVIIDMLKIAKDAGGSKNFSIAEIKKIVDKYTPSTFSEEFAKIKSGKIIIPPDLGICTKRFMRKYNYFTQGKSILAKYIVYIINEKYREACLKWFF